MSERQNSFDENENFEGENQAAPNVFEGNLVGLIGRRLSVTNLEGKPSMHILESSAKVTCDGHSCESSHLAMGSRIRLTTKESDRNVATGLEALDKKDSFTS